MKKLSFLIVPDSFKDCMPAYHVGQNIKKGILSVFDESPVKVIPMADGGEGTVKTIVENCGGEIINIKVHDPLGRLTDSFFGLIDRGKTAVIEMAAASGIEQLKTNERNPWLTSTFGTGELIKAALDRNCSRIVVGIGGSATNDGGMGMARALGIKFLDHENNELDEGGGSLGKLSFIDKKKLDERIAKTQIIAATDVESTLTGKQGASLLYGPQKGATPDMAIALDNNLLHLANIIEKQYGYKIKALKGGGAAGGLGAGLFVFLNAKIASGFDTIALLVGLEKEIKAHQIIITAEGKVDAQTEAGKTPIGISRLAAKYNKPVFVFTGNATDNTSNIYKSGITCLIPIIRKPVDLNGAFYNTHNWLEKSAEELCRMIRVGMQLQC